MSDTRKKTPCSECPYGKFEPDPDPFDWFCDDEEKIYCEKLNKYVAESMRPWEAETYVCGRCPIQ